MNRPSVVTYLIGNPLSVLALLAASGLVLWRWWHDDVPLLWGLAALAVMGTTLRASERISQYARWKREWDTMAGVPPSPPLMKRIAQIPGLRVAFWIGIWAAAAYWQPRVQSDPWVRGALTMLTLGMPLALGIVMVFRLSAWLRQRRAATSRLAPAGLRLGRPRTAASRETATQALPAYCKQLMASPRPATPSLRQSQQRRRL